MCQKRYILDMETSKRIVACFYKSEAGNEPVRDFFRTLSSDDKKSVGADIMAVEMLWPVGYPSVRKMDKDLWEVRSNISDKRIVRVFFTVSENKMILIHVIIKKSQKTPKEDLALAIKRRDSVLNQEVQK